MPYATLADVQARYEKDIPDDLTTFVEARLDDANMLLDVRVPSLAGRLGSEVPAGLARMVVVDAVLRVLRNPDGFKGEHGAEYGYYYGSTEALGRVAFSPEDLADLQPSGQRSRVRSVGLDDDALCHPMRGPRRLRQSVTTDPYGDILTNPAQQADPDEWL